MFGTTVIHDDFTFSDTPSPSLVERGQRGINTRLAIENLLNPPIENESKDDSSTESEYSICVLSIDGSHQNPPTVEDGEDVTTVDEMDVERLVQGDASNANITNDLHVDGWRVEEADSNMANVDGPEYVVTAQNTGGQNETENETKTQVHPPPISSLTQSSKKRPYAPLFFGDTSSNAGIHVEKRRKDSHGTSNSAVASRALRETFRSGKLEMDKKKVARWKQKCCSEDPNVEFDKKNITARHSKCGEFIKMKEPYDATRFKEHVKRCTPEARKKKPAAGMLSLWKWVEKRDSDTSLSAGSTHAQTTALETEPNHPCPGLTEQDDSHIPKYLKRTGFVGGGARALVDIAKDRFGKAFSELGKQKKQDVVDIQLHEHKWRNDHQGCRVFATKCKQQVPKQPLKALNLRTRPCEECNALLSNNRFRAILRKPTPDDKNFIYTNHRYRSKNLGEIYARTIGLRNIIENPVHLFSPYVFWYRY